MHYLSIGQCWVMVFQLRLYGSYAMATFCRWLPVTLPWISSFVRCQELGLDATVGLKGSTVITGGEKTQGPADNSAVTHESLHESWAPDRAPKKSSGRPSQPPSTLCVPSWRKRCSTSATWQPSSWQEYLRKGLFQCGAGTGLSTWATW